MKLLRDKRELTKVLLLFELTTGRYSAFKPLADKFEITIQAISDYFKIMTDEGLVHKIDGVYKPTQVGVDFLHNHFTELRDFVDNSIEKLAIISNTSAKAGNKINKGDHVGLFMEMGVLVAYCNRRSTSMGVATTSADKHEEVGIANLEGIVKLKPGKITIISLPDIDKGGSKAVSIPKLRLKLEGLKPDLIGVRGIVSEVIAEKLRIGNSFKFAVSVTATEAAQHGLNVIILASNETIPHLKLDLEKMNQDLIDKIEYRILNL
jgi:putative transcriptional regulator